MYIYQRSTPRINYDAYEEIFLWKDDNLPIYVMDNHRLALWCWEQEYAKGTYSKIRVIHIDRHWDGNACLNIPPNIKPVGNMSIDEYQDQQNSLGNFKLFLWDNYIDYFKQKHLNLEIKDFSSDNKSVRKWKTIIKYLDNLVVNPDEFLIINLDIDAFFTPNKNPLNKWLDKMSLVLWRVKKCLRQYQSKIVVTIAFSPTCCYGEKILNGLVREMKLIERDLDIDMNLWKCLAPFYK
ncbi:UPF0489 domain-containing protein [Fibrobacter sp. UWT2]|uniref:UPF0489 family protein n=1 Tax=Fibrobacter sp. UWT2 TaxID=1896224 RepID=UPI0009187958|nr:UPF0489 family protein [Fibrobacter sp. UWT2]SHL46138.1 UPF0489 domain-containing protein [Fibrobacter sp. UWT2]